MVNISATDDWRIAHPGASLGLLEIAGVDNTAPSAVLERRKREIETCLRERWQGLTRQDFQSLPIITDYVRYYRGFDKTYHVLLQVESLVLKGRNLPNVNPLVDANFMAEMETLVLTAGHDAARLIQPVLMDVSRAGDQITQMDGTCKAIRAGDMVMRDAGGVSCAILYGQDNRSPITSETTHALYVAYAPAGVPGEAVEAQLRMIAGYVQQFSPPSVVQRLELISAC